MMDMSKGYKEALLLLTALTLLLFTGCGARIAPTVTAAPEATPTWDVPPPPTPTPLLSPPPEAVPSARPTVSPTPRVTSAQPSAEGRHYPLKLPEERLTGDGEPAAETAALPTTYTVERGDCLWTIAETLYGEGTDWRRLWAANREAVEDPSLVLVGQVLKLPEA